MTSTKEWTPPEDPIADLLDVLDLEQIGPARISVFGAEGDPESELGDSSPMVYVGRSQRQPHGRVFGGQVLSQSLIAAGRSVADVYGSTSVRPVHSLHAYFVRPGDDSHPIRFAVENIRDGNSFSVRRVLAIQYGKPILSLTASFQAHAEGLDHQDQMPPAPDPEHLPSLVDLVNQTEHRDHPVAAHFGHRPIDVRHIEGSLFLSPGRQQAAMQSVWMRAKGPLGTDDPLVHAAVLAYASDFTLLEPVLRRHHLSWGDERLRVASLDHAMWFHRPIRADEWMLYVEQSPSASSGRGLGVGRLFDADGVLMASVAQEGMVRLKKG